MSKKQFAGKTFGLEELAKMPQKRLNALLALPNIKMHGTGVVRRADGTIKYDDDAKPGIYHESPTDMAVANQQVAP